MSEPDPKASVLGQLPRTRPAVRSPRRVAADTGAAEPRVATEAGDPAGEAGAAEGAAAELESLARAGVSVAGGVASIGVRIAGEAVAALRGAIERR